MKARIFLLILAITAMASIKAEAQGRKDAFVAGAGFSVNTPGGTLIERNYMMRGITNYNGEFYKYELNGSYEKFLWKDIFVMPGISLWYSDNHDYLFIYHINAIESPIEERTCTLFGNFLCPKSKAWQIGGTVSAMLAWRMQLKSNFSVDFLTGPMLNLCFKGKVTSQDYTYDNLYRTATFTYRFGVAANIKCHWRIGVNFDLNTAKNKTVDLGIESHTRWHGEYLIWAASGMKKHNAWSFSVGYRF